ncbi:hypothetical protein FGG08_005631 [Glutinoglossum americanum]|uniref:Nudix hydrolase domain-containing protein n=1 Tax=Glutinoglossum americanum TaxID=1670608 RepID=A0A9P8L2Q7_9PEZI|nr:hypothetical protein FGG08_005631 [Glutinoglossum americanum]
MSPTDAEILSREPLSNEAAAWTKLVKTTYKDPNGKLRTWESAERRTRPANSLVDGVGIIAILEKPTGPELLLQKQFRPPVDKVCIEVPAGLIDAGESPEQCAVRELKEETGYVGQVVNDGSGVSPLMFNDPGFCNTNLNFVHVSIDMSKKENQNPKPELEENEFIEVFSVPLLNLYSELRKLEKDGFAIDARVGTLAEGFEVVRKWKLW